MKDHAVLMNEVRYAERLCERTARLYRRLETWGTVAAIISSGGVVASAMASAGPLVSSIFAVAFAAFSAATIATRPADKAAENEADRRRYAKLRADGVGMSAQALSVALLAAKEGSAPEVESLRLVAFNDVVREVGQGSYAAPLTLGQRLLAAIA